MNDWNKKFREKDIFSNPIFAEYRECWIKTDTLRQSAETPDWTTEPTLHALVLEAIAVRAVDRQKGHARNFIAALTREDRFELIVVEMVGNPILQAALTRWGWKCNPLVMDFYWPKSEAAKRIVDRVVDAAISIVGLRNTEVK